jgi:selenide,water dikinase
VLLADGGTVDYDYLSINIGALPNFAAAPGALEHAVGLKPFKPLLARWRSLSGRQTRVAIAGGGAAGVEVAMAMKFAGAGEVTVFSDKQAFAENVEARVLESLQRTDVALRSDCPVTAVEQGPTVISVKGRERFDALFWAAGTAPPLMLAESGLATDAQGYALVDASLRSVSDPHVFAAGDCATLREAPHARSGVFAVRHGHVLAENLTRVVRGSELVAYEPQKRSLVLLSCGGRYAIAARGSWSAEGAWAWHWKDWIDRRWVKSFR